VQAAYAPPSIRHSKVAVASAEEKLTDAEVVLISLAGAEEIVVSGAVWSTTTVSVAGVASVFPAVSVARTLIVCDPSERPVYVFGLVQASYAPSSSLQANVAPASEEKVRDALVLLVGVVLVSVAVVSGAVVSTVNVTDAGEASTLPAASIARTRIVFDPAARPVKV
jgi:hypothetical protein